LVVLSQPAASEKEANMIIVAKSNGDLLPCMEIAAYNFHLGLLLPEPFGWIPKSLLGPL